MRIMTRPPGLPCPVCGRPAAGGGPAPCPTCGLPAVGEAALVVARIGATIDELTRDRDRLLVTLRAATPGAVPGAVPGGVASPPVPPQPVRPHEPFPSPWSPAAPEPAYAPPPVSWPAPQPPPAPVPGSMYPDPDDGPWGAWGGDGREPAPVRRLSPQQVLLALGALLLVAGAVAFVAVAWNRLGVSGQAAVLLAVTAALCGASAWTARRGLRATEEALAGAGAALLAVDLAAAHALGLAGLDEVPLRLWTALSCAAVGVVALLLGRLTRSTVAWPLVALLAAQPVPLLLLPEGQAGGPAGVAVLLGLAAADLAALVVVRVGLRGVARVLTALAAGGAALLGVVVAWEQPPAPSWTATGLLLAAATAALLARRRPGLAAELPDAVPLAGVTAGVTALAATGSLEALGRSGPVVATAVGLGLLSAAVLAARLPVVLAATLTAGTVLTLGGAAVLLDAERYTALAPLVLAAVVPALLAAVRLPRLRAPAVGAAFAAPAAAVLLAAAGGAVSRPAAGLLLALVAAAGFAVASLRAARPEETVAAGAGALAGLLAGGLTASDGAWGQVAVQLAVVGAATGAYALVVRSTTVAAGAVAALVAACWSAAGGAGVEVVEAYTLPAAGGLFVLAVPALRTGGRSWAAEGTAVAVALVPSALLAVAEPSAVRTVGVVVAAGAATVIGTLAHRQAPFVVGAAVLAWVALGRLGPYAPLLPRWITLGTVGLLLLVLGATYERRRQQAREAVAWVTQMR